jgi:hypothetical protein
LICSAIKYASLSDWIVREARGTLSAKSIYSIETWNALTSLAGLVENLYRRASNDTTSADSVISCVRRASCANSINQVETLSANALGPVPHFIRRTRSLRFASECLWVESGTNRT